MKWRLAPTSVLHSLFLPRQVPCKGVLVIPHWWRNPFWPVLTIDGIHLQQEFARPFHFYPDIVTGSEHSTCNFLTARVWRILKLLWRDSELRTSARKVSRLLVSPPCWTRGPLFRMYKCTEVGGQNKLHPSTTTAANTEEWTLVLFYCSDVMLFFSHFRKYN